MNINKYKEIIKETAVFPEKVENFGLAYAWLGLIDEMEEVEEAHLSSMYYSSAVKENLVKEIGDVCWYITAICEIAGLGTERVFSKDFYISTPTDFSDSVPKFTGNIKKYYRDGKPLDKERMEMILNNVIFSYLSEYSGNYLFDLEEVLDTNYNKLMGRKASNTIHGDGDNR